MSLSSKTLFIISLNPFLIASFIKNCLFAVRLPEISTLLTLNNVLSDKTFPVFKKITKIIKYLKLFIENKYHFINEKTQNSYKKSGVNISLANKFVKHINKLSRNVGKKTKNSFVKDNIGGFGSLFDISNIKIKDPVIVSCTDGVGTKLDLANKYKKFDTIGIDLVGMCVNDLIVQGAKPLFFLDYIATGKLDINKTKKILKGILKGCKLSKCDLIGGNS